MSDDEYAAVLDGSARSDYENYLHTDQLLALQPTPQDSAHRDELLFTTVHQSSELWLKLAVAELREASALLDGGAQLRAADHISRAVQCMGYVLAALDMLDRLDPWDYQYVRTALGHGSGFDSPGFRAMAKAVPAVAAAFDRALNATGAPLEDIYRKRSEHEALHMVAERLLDLDERVRLWRFRHYAVVMRALGERTIGLQGTPIEVLGKLIVQRQVPRLWEIRSRLTEAFDAEAAAQADPAPENASRA
jgi:tryptophan 2,3-dioxygenase